MSTENKALARRVIEEIWNKGNLAVADQAIGANYVSHDPADPNPGRGPQAMKQQVTMYLTAFPDLQFTIDEMLADGDKVVTRWTSRATHKGDLNGIAPTGKQINLTGISIDRIEGGKIVEAWTNWDTLGMMQQLGVVPQMAAAAKA